MAPTEDTILATFLLTPASLPTIISIQAFTALFPRVEQSSPEVKRLYRTLQHRRGLLTDAIGQDIALEVKKGHAQRRAVVKSRREFEEEPDEEIAVEKFLFGLTSNLPTIQAHTMSSILPELRLAVDDVSAEIQSLENEVKALLSDIRTTVSGLSDLRYGRLSNDQLRGEVLQGLSGLDSVCDKR